MPPEPRSHPGPRPGPRPRFMDGKQQSGNQTLVCDPRPAGQGSQVGTDAGSPCSASPVVGNLAKGRGQPGPVGPAPAC